MIALLTHELTQALGYAPTVKDLRLVDERLPGNPRHILNTWLRRGIAHPELDLARLRHPDDIPITQVKDRQCDDVIVELTHKYYTSYLWINALFANEGNNRAKNIPIRLDEAAENGNINVEAFLAREKSKYQKRLTTRQPNKSRRTPWLYATEEVDK